MRLIYQIITLAMLVSPVFAATSLNNSMSKPIVLSSAGTTYELTENLTCADTCFTVKAANITLDGNGYSATFATSNGTNFLNRELENWSDVNTPINWTVVSGTATRVASHVWGSYDAELSATAVIKSDPVTLAANKSYLYYAVATGDSNDTYSIGIFNASDDTEIESTTIPGAELSRGFAVESGATIFSTSSQDYKPAEEKTVYLKITCSGTQTKRLQYAAIDPQKSYGIAHYRYRNTSIFPDLTDSDLGASNNLTVQNLTIIEGDSRAVKSAGIVSGDNGYALTLSNVSVSLNGNTTSGLHLSAAGDTTINRLNVTTTSSLNFDRMAGQASIQINGIEDNKRVEIKNCTLIGDPQQAIAIYEGGYYETDTTEILIHHNNIQHKEQVTEGYAIALSGVINTSVYFNTINPDATRGGRGILLDAVANNSPRLDGTCNVSIYGNDITTHEKRTSEYTENGLETAGIRIRNWGDDDPVEQHKNLKIYNNKISAVSDENGVHAAYGININAIAATDSIEIYDNSITVSVSGTGYWGSGISMQGFGHSSASRHNIYNNTIISTHYAIGFDGNDGSNSTNIAFYSNSFQSAISTIRFGMSGYTGTDSDIDIYCNSVNNTGASGYPFYLNGTLSDIYISHNSLTNSNSSGYEAWADANESTDVIFCENGTIDVTGGGSVGTASAPCQDGSANCYSTAGSRYNGPYGHLAGLTSITIGAGSHSIAIGAGSGSITITP
jgi:hypothetical protein